MSKPRAELALPEAYESLFAQMLQEVATASTQAEAPLVPFWPIRGVAYDGRLMVIGRSVNGWIEHWTPPPRVTLAWQAPHQPEGGAVEGLARRAYRSPRIRARCALYSSSSMWPASLRPLRSVRRCSRGALVGGGGTGATGSAGGGIGVVFAASRSV